MNLITVPCDCPGQWAELEVSLFGTLGDILESEMNTTRDYDIEKTAAKASEYFDQGYNCAQSILLAMGETLGFGDDFTPRIAGGLGGGIGHEGELCGALTGGVLILGLCFSSNDPKDKTAKQMAYDRSSELMRRFAMTNGAKRCRDLTGVNMRTEEGMEAFRLLNVKSRICQGVLRNAVRQVFAVIEME
jgi:C_GCAxxG_C_C family probable redox protein